MSFICWQQNPFKADTIIKSDRIQESIGEKIEEIGEVVMPGVFKTNPVLFFLKVWSYDQYWKQGIFIWWLVLCVVRQENDFCKIKAFHSVSDSRLFLFYVSAHFLSVVP